MRIDKFLSECGVASRKEAARAAKSGLVKVDGVSKKDLSEHIDPERQTVSYAGRIIEYRRFTYVMLNKPEGYVSATDDKSLPFVTELLSPELRKMELFPVGRLDRDTVGLMILTNNGALAHAVLSPKRHVTKVYRFSAAEPLAQNAEELFASGITLADGYECKSAILDADSDRMGGTIVLTEGKYHQIKRMVAATGNRVTSLERISFAGIPLDGALKRGEYRFLSDEEIGILERAASKQI
jgi:16S rRNA pseudouridine516 synthase